MRKSSEKYRILMKLEYKEKVDEHVSMKMKDYKFIHTTTLYYFKKKIG